MSCQPYESNAKTRTLSIFLASSVSMVNKNINTDIWQKNYQKSMSFQMHSTQLPRKWLLQQIAIISYAIYLNKTNGLNQLCKNINTEDHCPWLDIYTHNPSTYLFFSILRIFSCLEILKFTERCYHAIYSMEITFVMDHNF